MTTEAFLWAIYILLLVLLALTIITARRGPWQGHFTNNAAAFDKSDEGTPISGSGIPPGAYIHRVDSPTHATLRRRRRWFRR